VGGGNVWDVVSALGTILAVVAAISTLIYVEEFKPRRRRPKLHPSFERGRAEYEATVCPDGVACEHWLRLRVTADRDRDAADNVEVLFLAKKTAASGEPVPVEPRNLRWSATTRTFNGGTLIDLLADDAPEPKTRVRVPGGTYRYVDVLQASDSATVASEQQRVPRVCTWPFHADRHMVGTGDCALFFSLTADKADTTYFALDVAWDGEWSADADWWNHLVVEGPRLLDTLPPDI
jgi:hypothetical protein